MWPVRHKKDHRCYAMLPKKTSLHGQQHERAVRGAYLNQNEKENMGKFDNRTVETFWSPELSKKATEGGRRGEKTGHPSPAKAFEPPAKIGDPGQMF